MTGRIEALTIEELSARVGMTTRNIRAHQTRGLLPPPVLHGRSGRYGREHVERLHLIARLQDEGLNLHAIAMVLAENGEDLERVRRAVLEPWENEAPTHESLAALVERLGGDVDPSVLQRALDLRLVEPVDTETVRVLQPKIVRSGEAMLALGVPVEAQIEAVERVDEQARAVAAAYMELAREHLVSGLVDEAITDPDRLHRNVQQLQTVAADVLLALFNRAMTEASEQLITDLFPTPGTTGEAEQAS